MICLLTPQSYISNGSSHSLMKVVSRDLREEILRLSNVEEGTSRFGSTPSFTVNGKEFAHFHNDEELDIRLPLIEYKRIPNVSKNPYTSKWIYFRIKNRKHAEVAFQLIKTAYSRVMDNKKIESFF